MERDQLISPESTHQEVSALDVEWYGEHVRRGHRAIIGVAIATGFCVLMFFHEMEMIAFLKSLRWDVNPDMDYAEQLDAYASAIAIGYLLSLLIGGIFFIRWLHHLHLRLRRLEEVPWGEQQAIWSWIVPFLNLYRPVQIVRRSFQAMVPAAKQGGTDALIIFWWVCFVASNGISRMASRISGPFDPDPELEELIESSVLDHIGTAVFTVCGMLCIWMIHQLRKKIVAPSPEVIT
jgi:hypothetical protein